MSEYDPRRLHASIRRNRFKLGMTVPEYAALLGVSRQTVYNWENEKYAIPRYMVYAVCWLSLCDALGVERDTGCDDESTNKESVAGVRTSVNVD